MIRSLGSCKQNEHLGKIRNLGCLKTIVLLTDDVGNSAGGQIHPVEYQLISIKKVAIYDEAQIRMIRRWNPTCAICMTMKVECNNTLTGYPISAYVNSTLGRSERLATRYRYCYCEWIRDRYGIMDISNRIVRIDIYTNVAILSPFRTNREYSLKTCVGKNQTQYNS